MLKLIFVNLGLFIVLVVLFTLMAFLAGFASNNTYDRILLMLYWATAIVQIGINYLIFKNQFFKNLKGVAVVLTTVICIYSGYLMLGRV